MANTKDKVTDADNKTYVDMQVLDDATFLSPFSKKDSPLISQDVANFLENSVQKVKPKEELVLRVYSDCIDDTEKGVYNKAIINYYSESLVSVTKEHKRNKIIALLLFLLGVITIGISIYVGKFGREIWMEAIDIVAWVFCWEAVDVFVFKNRSLGLSIKRYETLSKVKIEFYPLTEK